MQEQLIHQFKLLFFFFLGGVMTIWTDPIHISAVTFFHFTIFLIPLQAATGPSYIKQMLCDYFNI